MTRCKSCLAKNVPRKSRCPVCGIEQDKCFGALPPNEKRIWIHARGIRMLALFHLIVVAAVLMLTPCFPATAALLMLAAINLFLALGLERYSLTASKAATVYYFLLCMVNLISIQHGGGPLAGIIMALAALYLVGNKTAKAIFERNLPAT